MSGDAKQRVLTAVFPERFDNFKAKSSENVFLQEYNKREITSEARIEVNACGSVSVGPDRCRLTITISYTKSSLSEVKESVNRRANWILQTLHNLNIPDSDTQAYKRLGRTDEGSYQMMMEIIVAFSEFGRFFMVTSLLVEKLDQSVKLSQPLYYHSSSSLEIARQQAASLAVHNARVKATEMASSLGQEIGNPMSIQETATEEWSGVAHSSNHGPMDTPLQRHEGAVHNIKVKVKVTFSMTPKKA